MSLGQAIAGIFMRPVSAELGWPVWQFTLGPVLIGLWVDTGYWIVMINGSGHFFPNQAFKTNRKDRICPQFQGLAVFLFQRFTIVA